MTKGNCLEWEQLWPLRHANAQSWTWPALQKIKIKQKSNSGVSLAKLKLQLSSLFLSFCHCLLCCWRCWRCLCCCCFNCYFLVLCVLWKQIRWYSMKNMKCLVLFSCQCSLLLLFHDIKIRPLPRKGGTTAETHSK